MRSTHVGPFDLQHLSVSFGTSARRTVFSDILPAGPVTCAAFSPAVDCSMSPDAMLYLRAAARGGGTHAYFQNRPDQQKDDQGRGPADAKGQEFWLAK